MPSGMAGQQGFPQASEARPEIKRLLASSLARSRPPCHADHWLNWRRRHQARSRWFHKRARLNRDYALVS